MRPSRRLSYRRVLFWALLILFLWLVISRLTEIKKLADTLAQGQWEWVLVAAGLQVIYYLFYTEQYRAAFSTVDVKSRLVELLPVMFGSIFVNVAAPTGGASGAALFVDDAARRGESATRATVGIFLSLVADYSSFAFVLVFGVIYLFLQHDLKPYEIVTAIILFLLTLGLAGVLLLGILVPAQLRRLLGWVQALTNRLGRLIRRPTLLDDRWVEARSVEFSEAAVAITTHPDRLARTMLVGLVTQALDLASLYTVFLAFHQPVTLDVLVAGYAMGILFWIVSITPQGIGVVEGIMTLVFTSLGIPADRAAIIAVSFRGLTFWLPLAIGFFMVRRLRSFGEEERVRPDV